MEAKMEPMIRMPLYKWLIAAASIVLVSILAVFVFFIISDFAEKGVGESLAAMRQEPSQSDEPTKKLRNPNAEIRGVWIASVENIDFPSKQGLDAETLKAELEDIVNTTAKAGLNTIYFQVRPASDALYDSAYFPVSKFLTGTQGTAFPDGLDPLAYLIEIAHEEGIYVHAWVNPLRVTTGSADIPQHDLNALAEGNPARKNPTWVIPYADGKLYYDAGNPDVRKMIAAGVAEIVRNYEVDGVIFDDYFYPYPVKNGVFDDAAAYEKYGNGMNKADWRRDNVNKMVEACYNAVKGVDSEALFGIAPCGIWQNDNGSNGGSDTKGFNGYSEIYCDSLAWAKGGYIDYIAPQIYWAFNFANARYDVLVKWWNQQLDAYDNVDLLISHGMYRSAEWNIEGEIKHQIEYARSTKKYTGSILYGYAALKRNDMNLMAQLQEVYAYDYVYEGIESNDATLSVSSPSNGSYINIEATYVIGKSDPAYPLFIDGVAVPRTKSGYFSLYLPLVRGKNEFAFTHKEEEYTYTVNRGAYTGTTAVTYQEMDGFKIISVAPTNDYLVPAGTGIEVTVVAPSKSTVTAKMRGAEITLRPTISPPNNADYMRETYTGVLRVPNWAGEGEIASLGDIEITAVRGTESATAKGGNVRIMGKNAFITIEVAKNDTELKVSENSWYYDDYTPASIGMRDMAYSLQNGYYKLRMGGYLAASGVKEIGQQTLTASAKINGAYMTTDEKETVFYIESGENVPVNGYIEEGEFVFTLYNVDSETGKNIELIANPMISAIRHEKSTKANTYKYILTLKDLDNFYGYEFSYIDGTITLSLRNPEKLPDSLTPLEGKVIIIDAGHGGTDTGAMGPDKTYNEKDMNLDMALAAVTALEKLGATVLTTRTEDTTVDIFRRLDFIIDSNPDLVISLHQNSMNYESDITKIRGLIGLYFADAGRLLTKAISASVSGELNRMERTPTQQRLAMVRNPKIPATLIEVGFITCVEEYDMMRREGNIARVGKAVADGVIDYYKAQEKFIK